MKRIEEMNLCFKGVYDEDVGARLISMPIRQQTALRGDKVTLPGRDGFLFQEKGWQEITVKADIAVTDNEALPEVKRWLSGSGDLIFGDFPDYAYEATVLTVLPMTSLSKRLAGQKLGVTFTCQPFMHEVSERIIRMTGSGVFRGRGDTTALPLVKVEGNGAQTLTVNGRAMLLTLTANLPLYIDCDAGTAFTMDGENRTFAGERVTVVDDWFELKPEASGDAGKNLVSVTGGITQVTITPRWRYL